MKPSKNPTFPIIIAVLSLLVILRSFYFQSFWDLFGFGSVIIGVIGVYLYYTNNNKYDLFFYLWVCMQIPNIYLENNSGYETPFINAFPTFIMPFNFALGARFGLAKGDTLFIYVNAIPIGLYYLLKYMNVKKSLGSRIKIYRIKKNSFPNVQLPISGKVERIVGRNKLTAIYLIRLDEELVLKGKSYPFVILEPKDRTLIETKISKRQVNALRICESPTTPYHKNFNLFVDWVGVETIESTSP